MRALWSLVFAAVVLAFAPAAPAAPFSTAFSALIPELTTRRDTNYAGTLTRTQKKELKAINDSLARLAGTHDDLVDDLKSAKVVAAKLAAGFKGEFAGTVNGTLPGLVAEMLLSLGTSAEAQFGTLDAALAAIADPAARAAATAKANAARDALDEAALPTTPPAKAAQLLGKAMKSVLKGLSIVRAQEDHEFTARIGTKAFVPDEVTAEYFTGFYLSITARAGSGADAQTISLLVRPGGVGTFEFTGFSPFAGNFGSYEKGELDGEDAWYTGEGEITITTLDTAAGRVAGTFHFKAYNVPQKAVNVTEGVFDVTDVVVR